MRATTLFLCAVLCCLTMGCERKTTYNGVLKSPPNIGIQNPVKEIDPDFSVVKTVGNHSYIPLNIQAENVGSEIPSDHVVEILNVLDAFESAHPELEIIGWSIEKNQPAHGTPGVIFGLWVNHRPKNSSGGG